MPFKFNAITGELDVVAASAASDSFTTIQTPAGTSPVATTSTSTLTLTSSDNSMIITGNSGTDTVDIIRSGPSGVMEWMDDMDAGGAEGTLNWGNSSSGGKCQLTPSIDVGHIGLTLITTDAGGGASSGIFYKDVNYIFGGGQLDLEFLMYSDAAASVGSNYKLFLGFQDSFSGGAVSNGAWFTYTYGTNSQQWVVNTAAGGTQTNVNTSTAFSTTSWNKYRISVNPAGTLVTFYINNISVGTSSTHIPITPLTNKFGLVFGVITTAGTPGANHYIDYVWYKQVFTTPR